MHLALIISSLGPGGAERVMSLLANRWAQAGHKVTIITLAGTEIQPFFQIDTSINLIPLGVMAPSSSILSAALANLGRARALRRAVADCDPDAILSFQDATNVLTLLACTTLAVPIIVSDRVDPRMHDIGRIWSYLKTRAYPRASRIVLQTQSVLDQLPPDQQKRGVVIPNPIAPPAPDHDNQPEITGPRPLLVAAGRLAPQKGFDILLRAFAEIAPLHTDWTLSIFGEGEERALLENLAKELHISDRVSLPGKVDTLSAHFSQADLFVLSSRYEGFPNVLLEAMSCGLPCIAADCPSGPAEIITHGHNGLLIPPNDPQALARTLSKLMADSQAAKDQREQLGRAAQDVLSTYSMQTIGPLWDEVMGITD